MAKTLVAQYFPTVATSTFAVPIAAAGFQHVVEVAGRTYSYVYNSTTSVTVDVTANPGDVVNVYVTNEGYHGCSADIDELMVGGSRLGVSAYPVKGFMSNPTLSAALAFGAIPASTSVEATVAIAGVAVGDPVILGLGVVPPVGVTVSAYVSAAGVVTVRAANSTIAATAAYTPTVRLLVVRL